MKIQKLYILIGILVLALLVQLCSVFTPVHTSVEQALEDQALLETEHSEIGRQLRIDSILSSWKPSKIEHYKKDTALYESLKEKPRPVQIEKFRKKKPFKKPTAHVAVSSVDSLGEVKRTIYDLPSIEVDFKIDASGKLEIDPESVKKAIKKEKKTKKVRRLKRALAIGAAGAAAYIILSK